MIFTSDNGFFFGEHRLIGGKFLAYEPATHLPFLIRGPGIKPGTSTGELAANIDIAPTILELAGVDSRTRASTGARWSPTCATPSLRTRRPLLFESFVETSDVEAAGRRRPQPGDRERRRPTQAAPPQRAQRSAAAPAPRSWRRPRTTRESASAPTSTSPGRTARRSSTTSTRTPTSSTTSSKIPNFFPIRNYLHTRTGRASRTASAATCREPAAKIPLNRDSNCNASQAGKRRTEAGTRRTGTAEQEREKEHSTERRREAGALAPGRAPAAT